MRGGILRNAVIGALLGAGVLVVACSSSDPGPGGMLIFNDAGGGPDSPTDAVGPLGACMPANVSTFQPPGYHHATGKYQGACSAALIQSFYAQCLGASSTKASCDAAFLGATAPSANQVCASCLFSRDTDTTYGPLVLHTQTGIQTLNRAGCMELEDPAQLTCAQKYQASVDCNYAACKDNCSLSADGGLADYNACTVAAADTGCSAFTTAAACANAELDAGAKAQVCFAVGSDAMVFTSIAGVFCGSPPAVDGGAPHDGGADATPEAGITDAAGGG